MNYSLNINEDTSISLVFSASSSGLVYINFVSRMPYKSSGHILIPIIYGWMIRRVPFLEIKLEKLVTWEYYIDDV